MKKYIIIILCFLPIVAYADVAIIKYDKDGNVVWQKKHAIGQSYDFSLDHNMEIKAHDLLTWGVDFLLLLDSHGDAKWLLPEYVEYAAIDDQGTIYANAKGKYLLSINSEGNIEWEKEFEDQQLTYLYLLEDNDLLVSTFYISERNRATLYKLSHYGELIWKKDISVNINNDIIIYNILLDHNSNIFLLCWNEYYENYPYSNKMYVKLNNSGEILWEFEQENCSGEEEKIDNAGYLYSLCQYNTYNESLLNKINSNGDYEWSLLLNNAEINYLEHNYSQEILATERDRDPFNKILYIISEGGDVKDKLNLLNKKENIQLFGLKIDYSNNSIYYGCKRSFRDICEKIIVAKYDEDEKLIWYRTNSIGTAAFDAAVDEDDNIYVVGDVEDEDEEEEDSGCGCGG